MKLLLACGLLGFATGAFAKAACAPGTAGEDITVLEKRLQGCFPGTEAPEVELLNLLGRRTLSQDEIVTKFLDFVSAPPQEQLARRRDAAGRPVLVVKDPLTVAPTARDRSAVAALVAQIYDEYQVTQNGAPRRAAPPEQANSAVPPDPGMRERVLTDFARRTQDPATTAEAAELAVARKDARAALALTAPLIEAGRTEPPLVQAFGDAAYTAGDFETAARAADLILKDDPTNQAALSLKHATDGRTPTVRLNSPFAVSDAKDDSARGPGGPFGTPLPAGAGARTVAPTGSPESVKARAEAQRAAVALRLGDKAAALAYADSALRLDPGNAAALLARAGALNALGRRAEAVRDATAVLAKNPSDPAALDARLWAYGRQQRWAEALADADALLATGRGGARGHFDRAYALAGLGRRAEAVAELKRAAALDPAYAGAAEKAVQAPQDSDLAFLFSDDPSAAPPPKAPAPRGPSLTWTTVGLAGGALFFVLAVALILMPESRRKMKTTAFRVLDPRPFDLVRQVGEGGMGVVYEARDRALNRRVAVKMIREEVAKEPRERARFLKEARTVAGLRHPNIVTIYSIYERGPEVGLAFEFVDGKTLYEIIHAQGPCSYADALRVMRPVCAAVSHAHGLKVIHRDLKPGNIMVAADGTVKVMDFGIAREVGAPSGVTTTKTVVGTPPYMAPEQELGQVRPESDVFALAACFYELVTGRLPFAGTGTGMSLNKAEGRVLPVGNPALPAGLDAVLARALSPDPAKRPPTPAELLKELEALA